MEHEDDDHEGYENHLVCFHVHDAPDHCYRVLGRVIYETHANVVVLFCHPSLVTRVVDRLAQEDPRPRQQQGVLDRDDGDDIIRHFCAVLPRSVCWVNNHTRVMRTTRAATCLQRAFRRRLRDRAARTIQLAYLAYAYAPPCGRLYRRLVACYAAAASGVVGAG